MILTYPAPQAANLNNRYTVRIRPVDGDDDSWRALDIYAVKVDMRDVHTASAAWFDADEPVEVEVTVNSFYYIYCAAVRPLSHGIEPHVEPRRLTFVMDGPGDVSVELNKDRHTNLHLFCGPVETENAGAADGIAKKVGSGTVFRAGSDDVAAIIASRDDAAQSGVGSDPSEATAIVADAGDRAVACLELRKTVDALRADDPDRPLRIVIGPGYYVSESPVWSIPSHTDVYIAGGAVIEGAIDLTGVEDVHIHGRGTLYCGALRRETYACGVTIGHSRDIMIEGVTIINPPHYVVMLGDSRHVTLRNVRGFTAVGWGDGFDMMACSDVLIENSFLRTSDDCVAVYGSRWDYRGGSRDVTVRSCVFWADVAHPMMIGTHGDHEHDGDVIERIRFEDVDVLEHDEYQPGYLGVMTINAGDRNTVRDATWRNIRIEPFRHGRVLDIETKFNPDYNPAPGRLIERIRIENVSVAACLPGCEEASLVGGYDDAHPVRDVRVVNMTRDGRVCRSLADANITVTRSASDIAVVAGDEPGPAETV